MKTSTADIVVPLTMMGGQTTEKSSEWVEHLAIHVHVHVQCTWFIKSMYNVHVHYVYTM